MKGIYSRPRCGQASKGQYKACSNSAAPEPAKCRQVGGLWPSIGEAKEVGMDPMSYQGFQEVLHSCQVSEFEQDV